MRHAAQTCLVAGAKAQSRWGEHLGREVSEVVEDDTLELIGFVLDLVELLSRPGDDVMRKREQASGLVWRCASCTRSSSVRERLRCRSGCPSEVMFPIVPPSSFDPIVRERLQILGPAECWLGVEAPSEAMSSMPSWLPSSQIVDMRSAWSSSCPRGLEHGFVATHEADGKEVEMRSVGPDLAWEHKGEVGRAGSFLKRFDASFQSTSMSSMYATMLSPSARRRRCLASFTASSSPSSSSVGCVIRDGAASSSPARGRGCGVALKSGIVAPMASAALLPFMIREAAEAFNRAGLALAEAFAAGFMVAWLVGSFRTTGGLFATTAEASLGTVRGNFCLVGGTPSLLGPELVSAADELQLRRDGGRVVAGSRSGGIGCGR